MNGTPSTPKPFAFIQARFGSTRLPGKILSTIPEEGETTLLDHIHKRISCILPSEQIVFLVPEKDESLISFLKGRNYLYFAGSEDNVRERYRLAAEKFGAKDIIRLTGDNPFIDIVSIELLWEAMFYLKTRMYCLSISGLPLGMGVECFSYEALVSEWNEKTETKYKEHVSLHIKEDLKLYSVFRLSAPHLTEEERNLSANIRMTMDETLDRKLILKVWDLLGKENPFFGAKEVIQLYKENEDLFSINQPVQQVTFSLPKKENIGKEIELLYGEPKRLGSGHFERSKSLSIELQMNGFNVSLAPFSEKETFASKDAYIIDAREAETPKNKPFFVIDHLHFSPEQPNSCLFLTHPQWPGISLPFYSSPLISAFLSKTIKQGQWLVYAGSLSEKESHSLDDYLTETLSSKWKIHSILRIGGAEPKRKNILFKPRLSKIEYYTALSESEGFISYFGQSMMEALYLEKKLAIFGMTEIHKELGKFFERQTKVLYLGEPENWLQTPKEASSGTNNLARNSQNKILQWLHSI